VSEQAPGGKTVMFEDATFESNGRIHTRSLGWMSATFVLNGSILAAMIAIPLVRPETLPELSSAFRLSAPRVPSAPPLELRAATRSAATIVSNLTLLPPQVVIRTPTAAGPEQGPAGPALSMELSDGQPATGMDAFSRRSAPQVVHPETKAPVRLSSTMVAGMLISKTIPVYPAIARAARVEGAVVLAATIAKSGTIENLRVVSGPAMLEQAALDAVKSWRYRPYLLDGAPVEVETSITVIFRLGS
jgi:periplasmic protein TonB